MANQSLPLDGTKDSQVQPWNLAGAAQGEGETRELRMRTGEQVGVPKPGREEE